MISLKSVTTLALGPAVTMLLAGVAFAQNEFPDDHHAEITKVTKHIKPGGRSFSGGPEGRVVMNPLFANGALRTDAVELIFIDVPKRVVAKTKCSPVTFTCPDGTTYSGKVTQVYEPAPSSKSSNKRGGVWAVIVDVDPKCRVTASQRIGTKSKIRILRPLKAGGVEELVSDYLKDAPGQVPSQDRGDSNAAAPTDGDPFANKKWGPGGTRRVWWDEPHRPNIKSDQSGFDGRAADDIFVQDIQLELFVDIECDCPSGPRTSGTQITLHISREMVATPSGKISPKGRPDVGATGVDPASPIATNPKTAEAETNSATRGQGQFPSNAVDQERRLTGQANKNKGGSKGTKGGNGDKK